MHVSLTRALVMVSSSTTIPPNPPPLLRCRFAVPPGVPCLQQYNTRKHAETFWKSLSHDRYEVSCVSPQLYYERFVDFLDQHAE